MIITCPPEPPAVLPLMSVSVSLIQIPSEEDIRPSPTCGEEGRERRDRQQQGATSESR
jgi:hypothetical protein